MAGAANRGSDDADHRRTSARRRSAPAAPWRGGLDVGFEAEVNRFANPDDRYLVERQTGVRTHALGSIARPFVSPGWSVTPRASFNAATYSLDRVLSDGRRSVTRVIPTVSIDSAWTLERETELFGRAVRQTLEPRLFYVNTPYRRQLAAEFRLGAEGFQLRFALHRKPVLGRRSSIF